MKLVVGQKAPGFELMNTEKELISLESFKGKNVVLFFFPLAWTGVCTKEMCLVQEDFSSYKNLNATVIGISVDTLFALRHFAADYKLNDVLFLSDFNKDVINAYDVVIHDFAFGYHGVAKRATFVIDKEGIIRHIDVTPTPGDMPNMSAIKDALEKLN